MSGVGAKVLRIAGVSAVLIAAPVLLGRLAPAVLNNRRSTFLAMGLIMAIGALSLNLLMGYAGQISLGHGAFLGVGAFAAGYITGELRLAFLLAVPVAAAAGAVFAFAVGLPSLRIRGLYLAISTLAFSEAMVRWAFPLVSGGNVGLSVPRPYAGTFQFIKTSDYAGIVVAVFLLAWFLDRNVTRSRLGRSLYGIREDEHVAASFGVDVPRAKLIAFVLAGAIAGVAGSLHGTLLALAQPDAYRLEFSLTFVIIVVVGGLGSRIGVVVAALFFAILPALIEFAEIWQYAIGAGLLVYTIARHPAGLAQAALHARERKRAPMDVHEAEPAMLHLPTIDVERAPVALPPGTPVLAAEGIDVRFGGLQALRGAGIAVERGTIGGLIGPNGAGKTTLFNVLSGFQRPDAGRVTFLGTDVTDAPAHARAAMGMGRTFQLIGLARNLSVTDNFLLAQHTLAPYGSLRAIALTPGARAAERVLRDRAREAIAALGFERYADTPVRNLSGGQQRLVEIGCALVTAPEVLLLDEPSAGLSPAATESLAARLRQMRDDLGLTILLIEHHIPLVAEVCDRVTVLNLGEPLAAGPAAETITDPAVVSAYLGEDVA